MHGLKYCILKLAFLNGKGPTAEGAMEAFLKLVSEGKIQNTPCTLQGGGGFTSCRLCRRPPMPLPLSSTLLVRLQGYQTCVGAGMLAPGVANAVLAQHFVVGGLPAL